MRPRYEVSLVQWVWSEVWFMFCLYWFRSVHSTVLYWTVLNICRCTDTKQKNETWKLLCMQTTASISRNPLWTRGSLIEQTFLLQFRFDGNFVLTLPMMTSSNGNIFRVNGPLWGESTADRWVPLTKAFDAELWCFLWSAPEQTIEQTRDAGNLKCHRHSNAK